MRPSLSPFQFQAQLRWDRRRGRAAQRDGYRSKTHGRLGNVPEKGKSPPNPFRRRHPEFLDVNSSLTTCTVAVFGVKMNTRLREIESWLCLAMRVSSRNLLGDYCTYPKDMVWTDHAVSTNKRPGTRYLPISHASVAPSDGQFV